jgi:predicted phage terminase large subunit-like protein
MSDWFKSRWGDRFKLRSDQNAKGYFVNDKKGYRYSTSVTSSVIGKGGSILICMPYETKVSTIYGEFNIGYIVDNKLDIKILTYNHKLNTTEYKKIIKYYKHEGKTTYKLKLYVCAFQNGIEIEATEEHPVYVAGFGYKHIKDIKEYDRCLYNINNHLHEVIVKFVSKQNIVPEYVYNLEIEGNNNYFANNILVHNCDDPNAVGGESEVIQESTNKWWSLKWYNRVILNEESRTCRILVQQRGNELDVSGYVIQNDIKNEWVKLILPLEFEKEYVVPTVYLPDFVDDTLTSKYMGIWKDIRTEEGELLTERMDQSEVEKLKKELGSYDYAALYQQRPAPLEGGIIKKHWFRVYKHSQLPRFEYVLQSWDTALTAKESSAYSACTTWGIFRDKYDNTNVILISCWRDRLEYPELRERVKRLSVNYMDTGYETLEYNPFNAPDRIIIEAKASGDPLISDLNRGGVFAEPFVPNKHGDKLQRVRLITPLIEGGMVWMPLDIDKSVDIYEPAPFAKNFINEVSYFPNPRSLDYVDTMTQALIVLRNLGRLMNPGDYVEPDDESIRSNIIY